MRILLVEDDWQLGTAMKSHLRALGANVVGLVATTTEAERLIAEHIPDVALVDFNLRGGERPYKGQMKRASCSLHSVSDRFG